MEPHPTRWFELSRRELKALLCAAGIILLGLGTINAWRKATHTEEFAVYGASEALPVPVRIDINTAPAYELQFLHGIGEKRARDIIEYRKKNGPFAGMDDLKKISGIGPKTIDGIRNMAVCSAPEEPEQ